MRCPNCQKEAADTDQECPQCAFVLAKWRAAQAGAVSPAPSMPAVPRRAAEPEGAGGSSLETLLLFGLFLSVALYYFAFMRGATEPQEGDKLAKGQCAFSGEIVDIYRLSPAGNVRLALGPAAAAMTDAEGRYYIKVKPGQSYAPELSNPNFNAAYLEGFTRDWREATFEQRVRAARSAEPSAAPAAARQSLACEEGEERVYNFALVPASVTPEEKALIDAVP